MFFLSISLGIATARDNLTIRWSNEEILEIVKDFVGLKIEEARSKYDLGQDARDWKVSLAQADIQCSRAFSTYVAPVSYRPFDERWTYYTGHTRGFICMPRPEVMRNIVNKPNIALCFIRRSRNNITANFYVAQHLVDKTIISSLDNANVAPLYLYPTEQEVASGLYAADERRPNLSAAFIAAVEQRLGLTFVYDGRGDLHQTIGPEDIFHYMYAIFHSPTYRTRRSNASPTYVKPRSAPSRCSACAIPQAIE